jgi:outer membrane biosynthesis protein TonB
VTFSPPRARPLPPPTLSGGAAPTVNSDPARFYPERAREMEVSGRAVVQCDVTEPGA